MASLLSIRIPLLASVLAVAASPVDAEELVIVQNGTPKATIVVAKPALEKAHKDPAAAKVAIAARDLQHYLQKISGAKLPLVSDEQTPAGPLILVGKSRLTAGLNVAIPSGLSPARREEGFVIVCKGDRLLLAGNDQGPYHGTEYAVYDFLERLGVRWFMPGDFGEVVPGRPTLRFPAMHVHQRPDFILRNWWLHTSQPMQDLERRWKIRNKMNPDPILVPPGDSSVRGLLPEKYFKEHPEYFALNADGTRNPYLPNLSHPRASAIVAETIKEYFRKHPEANSFGFAPDDGLPRDYDPQTLKCNQGFVDLLGREGVPGELSMSEEWMEFVNRVARDVAREFPHVILTANGYANRNLPPQGVKIEPNVSIMFAAIWSDTLHAYDDPKSWQKVRQGQMLQEWCRLNKRVWIYGYNYQMLVSALTPVPGTRKLARDFPLLKKWGVIGFNDEARNVWAECGIPTRYLRARLEWNAGADVQAVLADFYAQWYGASARPAHAYWNALEEAIEQTPLLGHEDRILPYVYTPELMARLKTRLEEAERLADTPRVKEHVRVDRLIYEHLKGYLAMQAAEFAGNFAEAARQADFMMEQRRRLHAIHPFFCLPHENGYESGIWYWGVTHRRDYYRKLADLTSGKNGDLVALLPEKAPFHLDPHDEGRFARWYQPAWDTRTWKSILTTRPFYLQGYLSKDGYPYLGAMWYRLEVEVPASAKGKRIKLYAPAVETEAWCWVNGRYIGHRPYQEAYVRPAAIDVDVTDAVKPGQKNVIALRVATGLNAAQAASGLISRLFLYAPKAGKGAPAR